MMCERTLTIGRCNLDESARNLAAKSGMEHQHACFIFDGQNRLVSCACNKSAPWMSHGYSMHAEVNALQVGSKKLKNMTKNELNRCSMFVFRISRSDSKHLKFSRPCETCASEIQRAGIGRVYHS